jgi:predicted O-linked N-acetylglucosamine transferase (SPINDLY family)
MPSGDSSFQRALERHRAGDIKGALPLYVEALAQTPDAPAALYYGAMAARAAGDLELALQRFSRLIDTDKTAPAEVHYHHALTLAETGRTSEAICAYRQCLERNASFAPAHNNLGNLLRETGAWAEAEAHLNQALKAQPKSADTHYNRALVREALGRLAEATDDVRACLRIDPEHVLARQLLISLLIDQGARAEALTVARAAVRRSRQAAELWQALAEAEDAAGHDEDALAAYERARTLAPTSLAIGLNHAQLMAENGDAVAARAVCLTLAEQTGAVTARLRAACVLPVIPSCEAEIDSARAEMAAALQRLADDERCHDALRDPATEFGEVPFYLNYHGRSDDRMLLAHFATTLRALAPSLRFTARHVGRPRRPGRWRIGFCSAHLHEHSVGRSLHAMIAALPRERFEVHILRAPPISVDALSARIDQDTTVHRLPTALVAAQQAIAALELDLLYHCDVGMESLTYCLAHARLAPLQWTGLGHPCTTGLDTIDGFVSNAHLESADSATTYSERVIALPPSALYPDYPAEPNWAPVAARSRASLGLPEHTPIAICPQSLFKLMPRFDAVLAAILEQVPDTLLLLPEPTRPGQRVRFLERLRRHAGSATERVRFFPRGTRREFLDWVNAADLMLDPFPVSGGISTWDALATGVPLVTWPQPLPRSRLTAAALHEIGDSQAITDSFRGYVAEAVRRLTDRDWAHEHRAQVCSRTAALYADRRAATAFAEALEEALCG